jgi:hypothetical protein
MESDNRSLVVPSAVYLGAVILIGLPVAWALTAVFSAAIETFGVDGVLGSWGWVVVLLASLLVGLQVAVEAAALQLGGVAALGRGSRRVALVRYVAFTASVVIALGLATWFGVSILVGQTGVVGVLLGGLIALAALAVFVRSGRAFLAGFDAQA